MHQSALLDAKVQLSHSEQNYSTNSLTPLLHPHPFRQKSHTKPQPPLFSTSPPPSHARIIVQKKKKINSLNPNNPIPSHPSTTPSSNSPSDSQLTPHSTTLIPAPHPACPTTPTLTSYTPCQTACRRGCATLTSTLTHSLPCIPPPGPTLSPSIKSPPIATPPLPPTTKPKPTPVPTHSRPCYTATVTAPTKCPEETMGCIAPACVDLMTTTVPAGSVPGCPTTRTETRTRSCAGTCVGGCGTVWVTESVTDW